MAWNSWWRSPRLATLLPFCSALLSPVAASATGLLAGFGDPVYVEDYQGESAFPTTPEVDTLGIGGLTDLGLGNPPLPPLRLPRLPGER